MIECCLKTRDPSVRHKPKRRLHPNQPIFAGGHPDRPSLVTPDTEVDIAVRDEHGRAAARPARRVAFGVHVGDRSGGGRVGGAPQRQVLAHGLTQHRAAGNEYAGDNRRVRVWRPVGDEISAEQAGYSLDCHIIL